MFHLRFSSLFSQPFQLRLHSIFPILFFICMLSQFPVPSCLFCLWVSPYSHSYSHTPIIPTPIHILYIFWFATFPFIFPVFRFPHIPNSLSFHFSSHFSHSENGLFGSGLAPGPRLFGCVGRHSSSVGDLSRNWLLQGRIPSRVVKDCLQTAPHSPRGK